MGLAAGFAVGLEAGFAVIFAAGFAGVAGFSVAGCAVGATMVVSAVSRRPAQGNAPLSGYADACCCKDDRKSSCRGLS